MEDVSASAYATAKRHKCFRQLHIRSFKESEEVKEKPEEPKEPRGAELEEKDLILDVSGTEKLKIKSLWPREPPGTHNICSASLRGDATRKAHGISPLRCVPRGGIENNATPGSDGKPLRF